MRARLTLLDRTNSLLLRGSAVLAISLPGAVAQAQDVAPDYIVYDAHVLTVDPEFSVATAFAVRNGMFSKVGSDEDVLKTAGPNTRKIDLGGLTVMPAFTDDHTHVIGASTLAFSADLTDVHSIKDIQDRIAEKVATSKPGEWILVSRGWWNYNLAEKRNPTKAELDAVAPNNPLVLQVTHYTIANSAALRAAGITRNTPNPPGGEIEHDAKGEPTGILVDKASQLVRGLVPDLTPEQRYEGLKAMMKRLNSNGVIAVHEMGGDQDAADLFRRAYANGDLTVRVQFCYNVSSQLDHASVIKALDALGPPGKYLGAGMYQADCIAEALVDGATGMTAHTREDYPTRPGYRGIEMVSQEDDNFFAREVAKRNWRISTHSSGDAGIDETLNAYEQANVLGRRWSIEHANTMRPDQYDRIKKLQLLISSQYAHLSEGGLKTVVGWGQKMADQTQRFKDWLANGIEFSSGSDGPVSYKSKPLYWMYGLVTRKTDWGGSVGPDQGITREQAIRSFTIIPARSTFAEDVRGSIEAGKYADFVVVAKDVMSVPIEEVKDTKVLVTAVGGKVVYGDLDSPAH